MSRLEQYLPARYSGYIAGWLQATLLLNLNFVCSSRTSKMLMSGAGNPWLNQTIGFCSCFAESLRTSWASPSSLRVPCVGQVDWKDWGRTIELGIWDWDILALSISKYLTWKFTSTFKGHGLHIKEGSTWITGLLVRIKWGDSEYFCHSQRILEVSYCWYHGI